MYAIDAKKRWQNYQGSQRKPADFEAFWQAGFQEVDDLGTDYHLKPHPLNSSVAEAFDLTFTGVQGATVHCQLIRPKRLTKKVSPLVSISWVSLRCWGLVRQGRYGC